MPFKSIEKRKKYDKQYHATNQKRILKRKKTRYQLDKDKPGFRERMRGYQRKWYTQGGADYHRNWDLKKDFGISLEEYKRLNEEQDGKCAICGGKRMYGNKTGLAVDHNHSTGAIRGLLCDPCNLGLGKFNDDLELLTKAISYLQKTL